MCANFQQARRSNQTEAVLYSPRLNVAIAQVLPIKGSAITVFTNGERFQGSRFREFLQRESSGWKLGNDLECILK
jgi:hypothetical protein